MKVRNVLCVCVSVRSGKKLHQYAREDVYIKDRPVREITTKNIELLSDIELIDNKVYFKFKVLVSKGTYVRTICKNIGKKLEELKMKMKVRNVLCVCVSVRSGRECAYAVMCSVLCSCVKMCMNVARK